MLVRIGVMLTAGLFVFAVPAAQAGSFHLALAVAARETVVACPQGSPADALCHSLSGAGVARGLGTFTTQARTLWTHRSSGGFDATITGSITTAQGTMSFRGDNSAEPAGKLVYAIKLTGAGGFGSVTGAGSLNFTGAFQGTGNFLIDATLDDPSNAFDLVPPKLSVQSATAHSVGSGRYQLTVRYTTDDATTATLSRSGSGRIIATGQATGVVRATLHVSPGVHSVRFRLVVTDSGANTTVRTILLRLR